MPAHAAHMQARGNAVPECNTHKCNARPLTHTHPSTSQPTRLLAALLLPRTARSPCRRPMTRKPLSPRLAALQRRGAGEWRESGVC